MLGTFDLTVFILSQCFYFINNRHCLCFFVMINARCIFISKQVAKGLHVTQLANAGPKSVKVNLTNCHREVCRIKFYQIATSDVLTSL